MPAWLQPTHRQVAAPQRGYRAEPTSTRTARGSYVAAPARDNPSSGNLPSPIGSRAGSPQTNPPSSSPDPMVLGQTAPASSSPFTLKDVKADNNFHVVTNDGLKLSAQQAAQMPIDNRAIAVTGATAATITMPDGKQMTIPPNSRMALNYQPAATTNVPNDGAVRACTVCGDGLRRNVSVHIGNPRMLRTYVDQAIAGYDNCKQKATGDCTTSDILVRTLRLGCDGFDKEDPYHACIDKALGPQQRTAQ